MYVIMVLYWYCNIIKGEGYLHRNPILLTSTFGDSIIDKTRRLVNVGLHMMFRPELIYIFDLIVNQMKR